jgi:hypothetical protein
MNPPSDKKTRILLKPTLLALARGSVGSKAYRHLFVKTGLRRADATEDGNLSCAFFASLVLTGVGLLNRVHGTVSGTERAMKEAGWRKRQDKTPRVGDVLIWESKQFSNGAHRHIGFYVGQGKAVSTSSRKGAVASHDYRYAGSRQIESVYWNPKLNA